VERDDANAPERNACSTTTQNRGIVAAQVTMHHGHRTCKTNTLSAMNHTTNASAPAAPSAKSAQNQRASTAPARRATPIVIVALQNTMPRSEFGKPKTAPCAEFRFVEHPMSTLKLQPSWAFGFSRSASLSRVSANAAMNP